LAKHDNPAARVLQLLMVTGARKSEAMRARWADIVLGGDAPVWNRKAADQKAGHDHTLVLNKVAAQLLSKIRHETLAGDGKLPEFVFAGPGRKGHIVEIRKTWLASLKAAGIEDLHVHDLRHHFASQLASQFRFEPAADRRAAGAPLGIEHSPLRQIVQRCAARGE
jgi:integrase